MDEFENNNELKNEKEATYLGEDKAVPFENNTTDTASVHTNRIVASIETIEPTEEEITSGTSETVKEEVPIKKSFKKTIALGLTGALISGASFGYFMGVGLNVSKNLFSSSAAPFSFENNADTATVDAAPTALDLNASEEEITSVVNSVENSVVNISIKVQTANYFNQVYESTGSGSGIIYSQDDNKVYILTNNHVVDGASSVTISITGEESINASLVGKDASSDIAIISVLKTDLTAAGITDIDVATFGSSDNLEVGQYVIAIGNALGQGKTATRGIVSAVNKDINIDGKTLTVIQTDAAINPGNSGGALVNTAGEVIGINTAKTATTTVEGAGYAIPISTIQDIINQLMNNGTVDKAYLGVTGYTITDDFKQMYNINIDGVFIGTVASGSAAEVAGLQPTDIITAIDGVTLTDSKQLSDYISKKKSGDTVTLDIIRNGSQPMTLVATLTNYNEKF